MTLSTRLVLICSLLLCASALQGVLWFCLEAPGQLQPVELLKPLKEFPVNLGELRESRASRYGSPTRGSETTEIIIPKYA
jgi:hypothetical protein